MGLVIKHRKPSRKVAKATRQARMRGGGGTVRGFGIIDQSGQGRLRQVGKSEGQVVS